MKSRNPALEESLGQAVTEVYELIRASIPAVPHERIIRYRRGAREQEATREEMVQFRLGEAIRFLWDHIRSLPSFVGAREVLLEPKTLALLKATTLYHHSLEPGGDWAPVVEWYVIREFIEFVLRSEPDHFQRIYPYFEEYIYSDEVCVSQIAQLRNFECEIDTIDLEDNLRIRRLTSDEVQDIVGLAQMSMPAYWPRKDLLRHQFGIETWVTVRKQTLLDAAPGYPYSPERVLTALRLFKPGAVFYNTVVNYHYDWKYKSGAREHVGGGTSEKSITHKQLYVLNKKETEPFVHLWKTIRDADIQHVSVALRRLESGLTQEDLRHRLVDFMIGFESLFGKGEGELSYRMATRLAWFLHRQRDTFDSRRRVYSRFRTAYALRSRVVHGAKTFTGKLRRYNDSAKLLLLVDEIEDYLRESIHRFLIDGAPKDWKDVILGRPSEFSPTSSAAG